MSITFDKSTTNNTSSVQDSVSTSSTEERAPRFTNAAIAGGKVHTAKHHSFSMPAETFVKGQPVPRAYPENYQARSELKNADEQVSHAGHDHRPRFKVDLPTHEEPSGSREGVGSLPGPMNAEYVAMLPDERMHMHEAEIHEAELHKKEHHHTKGPKHEPKHEPKHKDFVSPTNMPELPTTEEPSGSSVGIGSMPGKNREAGVATLPAERIGGKPYGQGRTGFEPSLDNGWKAQHHQPATRSHPGVDEEPDRLSQNEPSSPKKRKLNATAEPTTDFVSQVEHAAEGVLGAVEEVASGVYHGAENLFHNVEAFLKSPGHSNVAESTTHAPPTDKDITGAMNHPQSVTQAQDLPQDANDDYAYRGEYDLFGEPMDTDQFVYDDDLSYEGDRRGANERVTNVMGKTEVRVNPLPASTTTTTAKTTTTATSAGDVPKVPNIPREGTAVGYGSIEYNLEGKEGVLPGYPTPEGMATLIGDRLKDDLARVQEAKPKTTASSEQEGTERHRNRARLLRSESTVSNRAVSGSNSELPSADDLGGESLSDHQIIEELREVPVFLDGGSTATGKYEAVFEPVEAHPVNRAFTESSHSHKIPKCDHPASYKEMEEECGERERVQRRSYIVSGKVCESMGPPMPYLGEPVWNVEETAKIEEARTVKKAGIN